MPITSNIDGNSTNSVQSDSQRDLLKRKNNLVLAIACVAQFMVVLDVSVVNVALPAIKSSLGFTTLNLQWVINAYALTFAGFLLLGGRAADLFGRRKIFLLGMAIFTISSLVGGLAQNQSELIVARSIQGIGGAILSPATLTIIITTFTTTGERARALGLWSALAAGGGAAGALVGGLLTDLVSWRWILFINVPIGIVAFIVARIVVDERKGHENNKSLDILGALLITSGLTSIVYGIVQSDRYPWASWETLSVEGIGVVLIASFVFVEAKIAKVPLIPLSILKSRTLLSANGVMALMSSAGFSMWFFISLYLQNVLGYSPLKTGFAFLPQTIAIAIGATFSAKLLPRVGPRPFLIIGTLLSSLGFFWLSWLNPNDTYLSILLFPGVLITLGLGFTFAPVAAAATSGVEPRFAGLASGLVNTSRQMGGALGLAVLATVASDMTGSILGKSGMRNSIHVIYSAETSGWSRAFVIGGILCLVGTLVAFFVPKLKPSIHRSPTVVES